MLKPDTITMVATDGHRLAVAEIDHKFEGLTREVRPLVPEKALTEVQRLAAKPAKTARSNSRSTTAIYFSASANAC